MMLLRPEFVFVYSRERSRYVFEWQFTPVEASVMHNPDATRIEDLRKALKECSEDLAAMVESFYKREGRVHPAEQRRYDRDMEPVIRARALLEKLDE